MIDFSKINETYLKELVSFLHSIKWMYHVVNTQYIRDDVVFENKLYLESLQNISLNDLPDLEGPQNNHPSCIQQLVQLINKFKLNFDTISTESCTLMPAKRISVKKQYEIEAVSNVIYSICRDEVVQLVDFGSGLGYLGHHLSSEKYGYKVLGLEGSHDRVANANERQKKHHRTTIGSVKHVQHEITLDSEEFILSQVTDSSTCPLTIFGLHGCGDLTVIAIKLFLSMKRVKKLIFMPCCYHKMSPKNSDPDQFNFFPLSDELQNILRNYPIFLNRAFLRLAGQQSPSKWKDMSERDHWIHGKNMFERALVEALINDTESIKRVNKTSFPENRVTMNDITLKYQLVDKHSGQAIEWTECHRQKFRDLREKYSNGEEISEQLFCLQTMIQNNCENLVIVDRIRFIQEQAKQVNLELKLSVKKLQNDKLSPRCLIIIAEK